MYIYYYNCSTIRIVYCIHTQYKAIDLTASIFDNIIPLSLRLSISVSAIFNTVQIPVPCIGGFDKLINTLINL